MKRKQWIAGVLSCTLLGLAAQQACAFFHHCCGCNKYSTYICCRPYNAFTPVCFGSICCQGCCPLQMCSPPTCGYAPCSPPPSFCPGCMPASGYSPMAGGYPSPMYASAPYMVSGEPPMIPPPSPPPPGYGYPPPPPAHGYGNPPPVPGYTPPAPAPYTPPAPTPIPHQTGYGPANGYYPAYWPNYPAGYWTNMYAPPGYWGTGGY